jgi:hypothetical protein
LLATSEDKNLAVDRWRGEMEAMDRDPEASRGAEKRASLRRPDALNTGRLHGG